MVQRTLIRPPDSRLGPATEAERAAVMAASPVAGLYDTAIDRESAEDILADRHAATQAGIEADGPASKASPRGSAPRAAPKPRAAPRPRASTRQSPMEALTKSVLRTAGSTITRELLRGLLGSLKRR